MPQPRHTARATLDKAIAPLKDASPGSPEAILHGRLKGADGDGVAAFGAIAALFKPARARQSHPLAFWNTSLIDVCVRAERLRLRAAERKHDEDQAQLIIDAAVRALKKDIHPFLALLETEAAMETVDYDLDAFGGGFPEADAAYTTLKRILLDRQDWGRSKLQNLRLTQKQEARSQTTKKAKIEKPKREKLKREEPAPPIHYAILAGLRDLVVSLADCAPKARQTHIAKLAGAIFGETISPEQVKAARKRVPRRGPSYLEALAKGKPPH
jgi:hypothetical protein